MKAEAKEWDEKYSQSLDNHILVIDRGESKYVPQDRPCDWCGEPVDAGFIHPECRKKETELYMDILY